MSRNLITRGLAVLVLAASLLGSAGGAEVERKLKNKATPIYPELARQMNINGTVRIEVVIAPNGTIKSTKALGGHPLLIQSATEALKRWRYEPGPETTAIVEFRFHE